MLSRFFVFDLTQGSLRKVLSFIKAYREVDIQIKENSILIFYYNYEIISISELEYHLYYIRFYDYYNYFFAPETEGPFYTDLKSYGNDHRRFESIFIYPRDKTDINKLDKLRELTLSSYFNIKSVFDENRNMEGIWYDDKELEFDGIYPLKQHFIRSNSINSIGKPHIYIIDSERNSRVGSKERKPYDMIGISWSKDECKFYLLSLITRGNPSRGKEYYNELMSNNDNKSKFLRKIHSLFELKVNQLGLISDLEADDELESDYYPDYNDVPIEFLHIYYDKEGKDDTISFLRSKLEKNKTLEKRNEMKFALITSRNQQLVNDLIFSYDQLIPPI